MYFELSHAVNVSILVPLLKTKVAFPAITLVLNGPDLIEQDRVSHPGRSRYGSIFQAALSNSSLSCRYGLDW
jgi:hypothetical protein